MLKFPNKQKMIEANRNVFWKLLAISAKSDKTIVFEEAL